VLSLVTATIGDAPIAILACAGLLLGVWVMARGTRPEAGAAVASDPSPPAPGDAVAAAPADEAPPAPAVGHGPIRFVTQPGPDDAVEPESPREPPPPPLPEVPPTTFRQGGIRVGGLERGRRRDS
jgi:hypothetical protein